MILGLSVCSLAVLIWGINLATPGGIARLIGSVLAGAVAVLTFLDGARLGTRISEIERGRYRRLSPGAALRIADSIRHETPQTVQIFGEGGDDVREVVAVLREALEAANWDIRDTTLGATLWGDGMGIMIYHTAAATLAATALIAALKAEGLPAKYAGDSTTGLPVHIAFRRP